MMPWHLSRLQTTPAPRGTPIVRALWLGLFLLFPLAGHSIDCRPVSAEKIEAGKRQDFTHGLLWKIETPGGSASYLFGTYHSSDPRIVTLPCPVQEAFNRSTSYTMEVIANGAGIVSMAEAMYFSDSKTLRSVLGETLYQETLSAIGNTGAPPAIDNMKPWAVMVTLSTPREARGLFLDMALQLAATRQGKPTYGLETMQEQIGVFNGMSLDDQVVLLRDAVQNHQLTQGAMEDLAQAYLKRDLQALLALSDKFKPQDARVYNAMMDRLLTQRNASMAERMQARLKEGGAFIAVGALHLPGKTGLLRLLADSGYRLTRVY